MEEQVFEIDDMRVPEAIREHASRFHVPIRYVVACGPDIALCDEDGEVVDICSLD
jgi:hypothetical protein